MSARFRVLAVIALALAGCLASSAPQKDILGTPAPDFELETISGERVNLKSLRGKVVVLDFWAVWCGPCEESMPFFQKLQDQYGNEGLEVVGLHVDDRMPEPKEVQAFLDERSIHYRNLVSTTEVDDKFMIYAMPTTYLIDREGVIRKRHVGFNPGTAPEKLETDVRGLLSTR
jgi:thiol-disulfide isomerase/thioredoxin